MIGVDLRKFRDGAKWLGGIINRKALNELEELGVDPCGEFGEFHTFVLDAPIFKRRIEILDTNNNIINGEYALLLIKKFNVMDKPPLVKGLRAALAWG